MISKLKLYIKDFIKKNRLKGEYKSYNNLYKKIAKINNYNINEKVRNEKEWLAKWNSYGIKYSPLSFKIFTKYVGNDDLNIIPLEICSGIVEPALTPESYRDYYNDKNSYDELFSEFLRPETLFRNINGEYYNAKYEPITNIDELIQNLSKS